MLGQVKNIDFGVCKPLTQAVHVTLDPLLAKARSFVDNLHAWPAMRVISLGIRTVPVLSVATKLAAPRPTPTAPAAKCGLIRKDEAD